MCLFQVRERYIKLEHVRPCEARLVHVRPV
jgi:hypothetical protein